MQVAHLARFQSYAWLFPPVRCACIRLVFEIGHSDSRLLHLFNSRPQTPDPIRELVAFHLIETVVGFVVTAQALLPLAITRLFKSTEASYRPKDKLAFI
jgi:hypothetical protein